jgi:hypothetical protein
MFDFLTFKLSKRANIDQARGLCPGLDLSGYKLNYDIFSDQAKEYDLT